MNIIYPTSREVVKGFWERCHEFKADDPKPISVDMSHPFIDLHCLTDYTPSKTFMYLNDDGITIGCATVLLKLSKELSIGGVCDVAVEPRYRKNKIGSQLMSLCLAYMNNVGFDISILWASIPEMYRKFGYIEIYENMMYRPIKGLPSRVSITDLVKLPTEIGTW
jgi:GNAT superfamily N-acetyltransferase